MSKLVWLFVVLLSLSYAGFADAQATAPPNLQDFFGVPNSSSEIGKMKGDNGSFTCSQISLKTTGPCGDGSYADQCASGNCGCLKYSCSNSGGTTGTGTGDMEIVFDFENGPTAGFAPDCYPLFGVYVGTGKKDALEEETDFNGAVCDPLKGPKASMLGGWQLISWSTAAITNGAGGTFTGSMDVTTGALKLTLKGKSF